METINQLINRAYENAKAHGFHEDDDPTDEVKDYEKRMLIITELGEAVNAHRSGKCADMKEFIRCVDDGISQFVAAFERNIKDSCEDEIADVVIRIFDFMGAHGHTVSEQWTLDTMFEYVHLYTMSGNFAADCLSVCNNIIKSPSTSVGIAVSLCDRYGIDIKKHIELKMKYNESRPYKHGKKY